MRLPLTTYFRRFVFRWCWLRYLCWRGCQIAGFLRRNALSGRRKLFTLPAVTIGAIVLERYLREHRLWSSHDTKVAGAVFVLGCLVLLVWQGRHQVVVEQFTDWTGTKQNPDSRGLATLLVSEIAKLRDLYTTVDQRALPTAVQAPRPLDATIQVEDVSSILESPAIVESKVSIGPVQVPLGAVLAIVGRAARGPRLIGGLHVEASEVVLTAQLASNEKLRTWRVVAPLKSKDRSKGVDVPHSMIEELALRMFTDLTLEGPVRWKATQEFTEALRAIRVCLRTAQDRRKNLLAAERQLIQALGEDEELSYVYYNLGIVYTELRRLADEERETSVEGEAVLDAQASPHAAEGAFQRQIELTPDRWEAYYALALTYGDFRPKRLADILNRCDRVVSLGPGASNVARALLVKGNADTELGELRAAMRDRRAAAAEAWAALCWSELLGDGSRNKARQLAATALHDLAATYLDRPGWRAARRRIRDRERYFADSFDELRDWYDRARARWLLGRPVRLAPSDAAIRFDRGRAALTLRGQINDIDEALRIDPMRPLYWAHLADRHVARALKADLQSTRLARALFVKNSCARTLALLDCESRDDADLEAFRVVADAYRGLDRAYRALGPNFEKQADEAAEQANHVLAMRPFAADCRALIAEWDDDSTVARLRKLAADASGWTEAQARSALGRVLLKREHFWRAVPHLRRAVALFENDYPDDVARARLRISLASGLRGQPQPDYRGSLCELRSAIAARPLRSEEREAMADAFYEMLDYEHARSSLEEALLWNPNRPTLQWKLGRCYWRLSQDRQDVERRKRLLRRAITAFRRALELTTADDLDGQLKAHYWLARLQKELGAYDHAIPYLRRATVSVEAQPLIHVLLGEAYVRARGYVAGEEELDNALANGNSNHDHDDFGRHVEDVGWEAARVRAHAHTLRALGYAERGVLLGDASGNLGDARAQLAKTSRVRERNVSWAACEDVAGLIFLRKGYAAPAIFRFTKSLALLPESETYVHLARACLRAAEEQPPIAAKWVRRGQDACRSAIGLDVTERYSQEATTLLADLGAI